ncbi:MAG: response regulator [Hydrogenophaga sp.]|nr:response regulator [Hydrogenophaga sp.]
MSAVLSMVDALDARRQRALDRLDLTALPDDPVLDGLVRVAARALRCPVAMVNVVGAEGAWSIANTENERGWMPRETAFCSTVVDRGQAFVAEDLSRDPRFARHPLVAGEPRIRFYAGLPVGDQGSTLGSLCVMDTEPRALDAAARQTLEDLARMASHWLASRRERLERVELEARQRERLHALVALRTTELEHARTAAEAASAAKSAFLATMSHEIRTPMNGVIGLIELMDRSGLPPHQQELLYSARESAHTLLGLIDDILDFSKIESGHLELEDKPFDLRRLIEGTADAWLGTASQQRVALHVFVQPELPPVLRGDAVRLRQVVANLLGNAIKFSGGRTDATGQVVLRAFEHEGALAIEVRDNGVGMAPDAITRLFRPFVQAEASTTRRFGGTGLGLAISQRLVQGMGGRITVTSELQVGSRFTVCLPLRAAPDEQPEGGADAAVDLAGVRCTWHGLRPEGLADWRLYLQAAGAEVQLIDAEPLEPGTLGHWRVERAEARGRIALRHGPQRGARADRSGLLWLDTDALHRRALLQAVHRAIEPGAEANVDPADAGPHACALPSGGLPVLVAEDNPVNRLVIRRQLQHLGVPVVMVNDGDQALARWRAEGGRFSALLTDLHMPGLDGEALCAAIRAEEPAGCRLPVLALTANAVRGEAERALAAGMDDYLTKPVPLERLAAALRRWLPTGDALAPSEADGAAPAATDFDPEALARAIGPDPTAQAEMRQVFLSGLARAEIEVREAVDGGQWLQAGLVAHRVKSSSHAVGAHRLGRLFDEFEQVARAAQGERLAERLGELLSRIAAAAAPVRHALGAA